MSFNPPYQEQLQLQWAQRLEEARQQYRRHLELEGKLRVACISHDQSNIEMLSPLVNEAAAERQACRTAINQHELEAHPRKDTATASQLRRS
jgi:hypothetical protein